jgi:hypothetical protein
MVLAPVSSNDHGMTSDRARTSLPSAVVRGSLDHGLLFLLGLVDRDPQLFERAAVAWHARWCQHVPDIDFRKSRAVLDALQMLRGDAPAAAAMHLREQCHECGLEDLEAILLRWADCHPQPLLAPEPRPRPRPRPRPWPRSRSHSHVTLRRRDS